MIKKIIKYGAVAGASFTLGTIVQSFYTIDECKDQESTDKIWRGECSTITMWDFHAEESIDEIDRVLQEDEYYNATFTEQDLKDVRRKLSHALSDLDEEGERVDIELTDRQRLRYLDHTVFPKQKVSMRPEEY